MKKRGIKIKDPKRVLKIQCRIILNTKIIQIDEH